MLTSLWGEQNGDSDEDEVDALETIVSQLESSSSYLEPAPQEITEMSREASGGQLTRGDSQSSVANLDGCSHSNRFGSARSVPCLS